MTTDTSQVLEVGQENDAVRDLQGRLQFLGFFEDRIDGYFAQTTEQAVREYQEAMGYSPSGRLEEDLATRLQEDTDLQQYHPATAENGGYAGNPALRRQQAAEGGEGEPGHGDQQGGDQSGQQAAGRDEYGQQVQDGQAQGQDGQGQSSDYRQLSEDGRYEWDGYAWHPVDGQSQTTTAGGQQEAGAGTGRQEPLAAAQQETAGTGGQQPTATAQAAASRSAPQPLDLDPSIFDGDEWAGFREYLEQTVGAGQSPVRAAA